MVDGKAIDALDMAAALLVGSFENWREEDIRSETMPCPVDVGGMCTASAQPSCGVRHHVRRSQVDEMRTVADPLACPLGHRQVFVETVVMCVSCQKAGLPSQRMGRARTGTGRGVAYRPSGFGNERARMMSNEQ